MRSGGPSPVRVAEPSKVDYSATMPDPPELYVAVDVEADGPIPGPYSMLSLGMAVAGRSELTFYTELQPISDDFVYVGHRT